MYKNLNRFCFVYEVKNANNVKCVNGNGANIRCSRDTEKKWMKKKGQRLFLVLVKKEKGLKYHSGIHAQLNAFHTFGL